MSEKKKEEKNENIKQEEKLEKKQETKRETKPAKEKELEEAQAQIEAFKRDNETLLTLNKQLQLAVGVEKGNDEPPQPEKKETPQEKQNGLLARILDKK